MDEITLFTGLRPEPPADQEDMVEAARGRLVLATAQPAHRPIRLGRRRLRHRRLARPQLAESPRRRVLLAAGAMVVAASMAIVVPAVLPGRDAGPLATAAWAVQRNPDGTIRVIVKSAQDAAGLQRALRADGVMAYVRYIPFKTENGRAQLAEFCQLGKPAKANETISILGNRAWGVTIDPATIPRGDAVLIQASVQTQPNGIYQVITMWYEVGSTSQPPVCGPGLRPGGQGMTFIAY